MKTAVEHSGARCGWALFWCLVMAVALTAALPVAAQSDADSDRDAEARWLFEAGAAAFDSGRFEVALERWQEAYALSSRASMQYNIGLAFDRLRRDAEALEAFRVYLQWEPKGERTTEVRGRVKALEAAARARQRTAPEPAREPEPQPASLGLLEEGPTPDTKQSVRFGRAAPRRGASRPPPPQRTSEELGRARRESADLTFTSAQPIVTRMLSRDPFGWEDSECTVQMVLVDRARRRSVRELETRRRRKGGRLQSVTRFRSPQEIAGTALLMREGRDGKSAQYIYFPGLRRTRKVLGPEREGSFMGSDFSYADLERRHIREATHRKLPDTKYGKHAVFVIESTPMAGVGSPYARVRSWVRKGDFLPLKIEFFDLKNRPLKIFKTRRIKAIHGRTVILEAVMENLQTGHRTRIELKNFKPQKNQPDTAFTPTALEHG